MPAEPHAPNRIGATPDGAVRDRPVVMGILNVTPDSFSDGGQHFDLDAAVAHGRQMVAEGAAVIDVGGESTRPGAQPVDEAEERRRVVPVVAALAGDVRVSVDTSKAGVARAAVEAGATLINDVSASLEETAAELGVGWVAMHMRGNPRTMQLDPTYGDVVAEVGAFLADAADRGERAGVSEIWLDPGIGFGKTAAHNLALLRHLDRLTDRGWPVVVGTSRKAFLGAILGASDGRDEAAPPDDRLEGSVASAVWAVAAGAAMVRVHDVEATVQAVSVAAVPLPPPHPVPVRGTMPGWQ